MVDSIRFTGGRRKRLSPHKGEGNEWGLRFRKVAVIFVLFLIPFQLISQIEIEEELDLAIFSEESISPELASWLEELQRSPINLRTARPDQLRELPGLSEQSARRILQLIDSLDIESLDRLVQTGMFDDETVNSLRLFTTLKPAAERQKWNWEIRSRFNIDLQPGKGFRDTLRRFVGSDPVDTVELGPRHLSLPGSVTTRVLAGDGRNRFGLVVDRDPGEVIFYRDTLDYSYRQNESISRLPTEPDVRSGHGIFVSGFASLDLGSTAVLIGDYSLAFGSGLLFGRPFSGRKGGSATRDPLAGGSVLRPHTSKSESGYLRGIAASGRIRSTVFGEIGETEWTTFVSRRYHDGSVRIDDDESVSYSIDEGGDLSTRTDLRRDDRIEERLAGGRLSLRIDRGEFGATLYGTRRSGRGPDTPSPSSDLLAGFDFDMNHGRIRTTGEIALGGEGWGMTGALHAGGRRTSGILALRHFSADFISPHAVSFAESPTRPDGETGLYAGLRVRPVRNIVLESYVDLYRQSSGDPAWPFPDVGTELMGRIGLRLYPDLECEGFLRTEVVESRGRESDESGRERYKPLREKIITGRFGLKWSDPVAGVTLRIRVEGRRESEADFVRSGRALFADLRWRPDDRVRFGARWTLFRADPGVTHYGLEQELPGGMTLASLSGRGRRFYLLCRYSLNDHLDIGFRLTETLYSDRDRIRSGGIGEIDGNRLSTISVQVDYRM